MTPALIAALVLAAAPAHADPPPKTSAHKPAIVAPRWDKLPNGDDFAELYPVTAAAANMTGSVTLGCKVHLAGDLFDCGVLSETPPGWGFGAASLAIAPLFKMRPQTVDGAPMDGASTRFIINWNLPQEPAEITNPALPSLAEAEARDPEALALARQVADQATRFDSMLTSVRGYYRDGYFPLFDHKDPARSAVLAQTFRDAINSFAAERRDRVAAALVFSFSRDELKAIKAFLETPAGAAFASKFPAALMRSYAGYAELWAGFVESWQSHYCAAVACDDQDFSGFRKLRDISSNNKAAADAKPAEGSPQSKDGKPTGTGKDGKGG